jgi:hypothetical protein
LETIKMAKDELTLDDIDDEAADAPSQLRSFAQRAGEKAAKVPMLEKENAALRMGIDVDSRMGQAWLNSTTVDFTDKEATLADATEFSTTLVKPASEAPAGETTTTETETTVETVTSTEGAERTALADGSVASAAAIENTSQGNLHIAEEAIKQGATEREAMGGFIHAQTKSLAEGKIAPLESSGRRRNG